MSLPRVRSSRAAAPGVVPAPHLPRTLREPTAPSSGGVPPGALARARWLLMGLFALNGLVFSSWLARIPSVRDALELTTGQLGGILLAGSVGSLVTAAFAGVLVTRYGGRVALLQSSVGFALAYLLIGLGPTLGSVPVLVAGIFLVGVSFALGNVPLNVETAAVERAMGRTVLPQFHAAFSIGAVVGSGLGALAAHLGVPLLAQFLAVAVIGLVWRLASIPSVVIDGLPALEVRALVDGPVGSAAGSSTAGSAAAGGPAAGRREDCGPASGASGPVRPARGAFASALDAWREPRTLLIGIVILSAALSEGSANDWLALAVVDGFSQTEAVGASVFAGFVAAMTAVRVLGTRLIDRFGRVRVLRTSGLVSLAGLLVFGFAPNLTLACVGVVAWGLGAALAVPLGIAAASDDPMRAAARVSVVSAFSSVASIAAPPLLGFAAQSIGARHALVLIAAAMILSVTFSRSVAAPETAEATSGPARPEPVGAEHAAPDVPTRAGRPAHGMLERSATDSSPQRLVDAGCRS